MDIAILSIGSQLLHQLEVLGVCITDMSLLGISDQSQSKSFHAYTGLPKQKPNLSPIFQPQNAGKKIENEVEYVCLWLCD